MTVEIPSSLLDELTREVNALSEAAQRQASIAIGQVIAEWDGEDVADLRTAAFAVLDALLSTYTDLSAARAAEFYDASREAQMVRRKYRAVVDSRRDPKATEGAIRAIVRFAADGDVERFRREALDRVDTEMRRAANQCVAYNAGRDPAKPLYARVPVGETCGFCLMLASFGFQYTSESAASHSHRKCNCRVVPSFGDATVRGYDPERMYGRFNECLSTLGGRDGIRAEWDALPKEYRDSYIAKHGNKAGDAFDAYVNKRVSDEIETRDPEWFTTGKIPEITKERGAKPLPKERDVSEVLAESGFAVEFIKEVNKKGVKTADARLCGVVWEFKVPEGYNGEHTVRTQFWKARGKGTSKLLISCTKNHAPAEDVCKWVAETFKKGDYEYIDEVLVMGDDGTLTRMKRPK